MILYLCIHSLNDLVPSLNDIVSKLNNLLVIVVYLCLSRQPITWILVHDCLDLISISFNLDFGWRRRKREWDIWRKKEENLKKKMKKLQIISKNTKKINNMNKLIVGLRRK